jgi:hypothetical protein
LHCTIDRINHHHTIHGGLVMTENTGRFTAANAAEAAKKGRARTREFTREQSEAIKINSRIMLEGLAEFMGREPTQLERFQAESISSLYWLAAHARRSGKFKDEVELLMKAAALARDSAFGYTLDYRLRRPAAEQTGDHA